MVPNVQRTARCRAFISLHDSGHYSTFLISRQVGDAILVQIFHAKLVFQEELDG